MAVAVLIPAAGYGKRMRSTKNKQFMLLKEKPVLIHTLEVFNANQNVSEIIVITRDDEVEQCKSLVTDYCLSKVKAVVAGGKERQHSVWNGLQVVSSNCETVVVHDGARPLLLHETLDNAIREVNTCKAVVVGVPVKDTIKVVDKEGIIISTPPRSELWAVQTPQVFLKELLIQAYEKAWQNDYLATDDAALVEKFGVNVKMILGTYENIKITTPEDLVLADAFLDRREKR